MGNAFSRFIITDLLRKKYNYNGVVCTDWNVTHDATALDVFTSGKCWGVENLSEAERHYKVLMAGVDQFGGNNDVGPVLEAYRIGMEELGEGRIRARFEESAVRLLTNILQTGLFENPYLNVDATRQEVGKPDYMEAGFEAQLRSVVLLKNQDDILPLQRNSTVYIPQRYVPASRSFFSGMSEARWEDPVNLDMVKKYFKVAEKPSEADFALVFIESPDSGRGYNAEEADSRTSRWPGRPLPRDSQGDRHLVRGIESLCKRLEGLGFRPLRALPQRRAIRKDRDLPPE